jgi:hypothetical protein
MAAALSSYSKGVVRAAGRLRARWKAFSVMEGFERDGRLRA